MTISRRNFLVGAAGAGVGFGLGAFSHAFPLAPPHYGPEWSPGAETFVSSTCVLCPAHCGIRARLVDGEFTRIDGNPLHPVSQGGLCPKGRAGIQLAYHPGRLAGPVRRVGPPGSGGFEPISWDVALDQVATALRSARQSGDSNAVEWLVGDTSGVMAELIPAFCRACGTDRITLEDYRDGSAEVMRLSQGISAPPAYDLLSSDLVLSFGAALAESWTAMPLAARARNDRDRRWIQVDARLSRTAIAADKWIPIRPGTYGTLALGLVYLLSKEGLYDAEMVSERVSGWEDWSDETDTRHAGFRSLVLRHGGPDDVSSRTGIPVPQLIELAKAFGTARQPVAIWDHAVSWRRGGLSDALAIHALNILRGGLNRRGGVLVQPPLSLPGPLDTAPADTVDLSRRSATLASWPVQDRAGAMPPPKVLFLYQSNPMASSPKPDDVRRAVSQVPLVVSFSPFLDESARHATLVLPDHTYLERWQDAPAPPTVAFPVWGVVRPVIAPLHATRGTGDVILDLASRIGGDVAARFRWASMEELVKARGIALAGGQRGSAFVDPLRQEELRELEGRGWWLPHGESAAQYWETILDTGGWFDPIYDYQDRSAISQNADGRVWIFPAEARRRLEQSGAPLSEGFLPVTGDVSAPGSPEPQAFPLRLVPYRALTLASGGITLMPWVLEHLGVLSGWESWAEVNPETARGLGLRAGQRVRVESDRGSFDAVVRIFAGAQPGVVNVPYGLHTHAPGWGDVRGANPLVAVGRDVDPVTGLPDWYSTQVRIRAI